MHGKSEMIDVYYSQECLEVARCEVAQISESPGYPVMGGMMKHFVPLDIREK